MTPHAYLVDDDDAIRDSLGWLLESRGVPCRSYPSAEDFLAAWEPTLAGCILLDIRMDGMSGPELFDVLCERGSTLPVIFLTGHGDVPMAVSALKQGAFDFVEKPCNDNELVNRVIEALQLDEHQRLAASDAVSVSSLTSRLTTREKQVMELVLAGTLNKVIADELQISMRTVEVHRANLFEKMGVRTAVELAQLLAGKR
ncbi:MAG: Transcriptional regulatory protein TdiR [Candidatus Accumulibacter regalis]|jgi:two-component system response regulator DctR|uniref:Transcriptional regulatory protein TdiR n=1 Tax=Accumulibacter regalis TaxID=522306 RepID=A0A011NUE6_ACCRE|nr:MULTISPECIES: response regulator [unclassified Candidatus Accumulibacter]EXI86358.1 MAG: Transcriptional regulatory protein TdiR [Candidatus Accumulibacter regalis]MQM35159.1 DNA-binding response regulator [Candidatus Accumulibacter phosphatis]MBL8367375.1 response regulator transcription factor [Accumulibacter sp.]MBN8514616.1 response regulator transcription factor [Accumulibacter sp.]MBO3701944.1 response regulator transcription factor [Accumulibacter sp.]